MLLGGYQDALGWGNTRAVPQGVYGYGSEQSCTPATAAIQGLQSQPQALPGCMGAPAALPEAYREYGDSDWNACGAVVPASTWVCAPVDNRNGGPAASHVAVLEGPEGQGGKPLGYVVAIDGDLYHQMMISLGYIVEQEEEQEEVPVKEVVVKKEKPKPSINPEVAKRVQMQLKTATYGTSAIRMLRKYDKDRSGSFEPEEIKRLIRVDLRIPPTNISDKDIDALVHALDPDGGGDVSIEEMAEFVERGIAVFQEKAEEAARAKEKEEAGGGESSADDVEKKGRGR